MAEIHETENWKSTEKTDGTQSWFFEKLNKIGKAPVRLTKQKRGTRDKGMGHC